MPRAGLVNFRTHTSHTMRPRRTAVARCCRAPPPPWDVCAPPPRNRSGRHWHAVYYTVTNERLRGESPRRGGPRRALSAMSETTRGRPTFVVPTHCGTLRLPAHLTTPSHNRGAPLSLRTLHRTRSCAVTGTGSLPADARYRERAAVALERACTWSPPPRGAAPVCHPPPTRSARARGGCGDRAGLHAQAGYNHTSSPSITSTCTHGLHPRSQNTHTHTL